MYIALKTLPLRGIQTPGIGRLTSGQQGFWNKSNKSMFSSPGHNSVLTAMQNRRKTSNHHATKEYLSMNFAISHHSTKVVEWNGKSNSFNFKEAARLNIETDCMLSVILW